MQVYPAAGLVEFTPPNIPIYYIDPHPATIRNLSNPLEIIPMNATEGVPFLKEKLMK
jgi:NAD-dependent deacetylase